MALSRLKIEDDKEIIILKVRLENSDGPDAPPNIFLLGLHRKQGVEIIKGFQKTVSRMDPSTDPDIDIVLPGDIIEDLSSE